MVERSEVADIVIETLLTTNKKKYQLLKATEELSELTTALLQYVTKKGMKTTEQEVIDEIGDVRIRLEILTKVFGEDACMERYNEKINKFHEYIIEDKYIGTI